MKTIENGGDAKAEAASLIEKLPDLTPEDPAMAAVIAEAMAAEFADAASGTDGRAARPAQPLANKEDQPRGKTTEGTNSGSFAPADGAGAGAAGAESPKAKAKREKQEWQAKAKAQGTANMLLVKSGKNCPDFMPGLTLSNGEKDQPHRVLQ